MTRLRTEAKWPRFLRLVPRPTNVSDKEVNSGQPVYIAGLQEKLEDLESRVAVLEAATTSP